MISKEKLLERIQAERVLLSDGAMGTMLHGRGVGFEECFDQLNVSQPAIVADIHREYIEAGSTIIQTNTFGANRYKLARHGLENRVKEINAAGVELARRVVMASFKPVLIAGDVGPLGVRLAPFGRVKPEQARKAFSEQISALVEADIDLLIIETMTDLKEMDEALAAARAITKDLVIIASMTFTRDDRTLLGDTPERVARYLHQAGADVIGVNCSGGPHQILHIFKQMRQAVPDGIFSVMPNAGWPQQVEGRIMYPASPDYFGEYALSFWHGGAGILGGCCGTTPRHIKAMATAIQNASLTGYINGYAPMEDNEDSPTEAENQVTQLADKLAAGKFVISVEMDPPRGLTTQKLLAGASLLAEAGADVIDVADSPMARMRMSPWAVCNLIQRKVNIETVLHFPTRGRNILRVQGDLLAAHALDVHNVFVIMGDPTAIGDYPDAMDNFDLVPSGLIKLIKQGFNTGVDHSGTDIGQPTSFFVGCALNLAPKVLADEVKHLHRKIRCGADFIITQPIYDPAPLIALKNAYEETVGPLTIPILAGIWPLISERQARFINDEVPGISIPKKTLELMQTTTTPAETGLALARDLSLELKEQVQGLYMVPSFSRYDMIAELIESVRKAG